MALMGIKLDMSRLNPWAVFNLHVLGVRLVFAKSGMLPCPWNRMPKETSLASAPMLQGWKAK